FDAAFRENLQLSHLYPPSDVHPSAKIQRRRPVHALPQAVNTRGAPGHPDYGTQLLESLLVSTTVVALGEIGDKTQLLALMLAVRFRKPWPIVAGILVATLVNHTIAGAGGNYGTHRCAACHIAVA